jgi:hypothetical protein
MKEFQKISTCLQNENSPQVIHLKYHLFCHLKNNDRFREFDKLLNDLEPMLVNGNNNGELAFCKTSYELYDVFDKKSKKVKNIVILKWQNCYSEGEGEAKDLFVIPENMEKICEQLCKLGLEQKEKSTENVQSDHVITSTPIPAPVLDTIPISIAANDAAESEPITQSISIQITEENTKSLTAEEYKINAKNLLTQIFNILNGKDSTSQNMGCKIILLLTELGELLKDHPQVRELLVLTYLHSLQDLTFLRLIRLTIERLNQHPDFKNHEDSQKVLKSLSLGLSTFCGPEHDIGATNMQNNVQEESGANVGSSNINPPISEFYNTAENKIENFITKVLIPESKLRREINKKFDLCQYGEVETIDAHGKITFIRLQADDPRKTAIDLLVDDLRDDARNYFSNQKKSEEMRKDLLKVRNERIKVAEKSFVAKYELWNIISDLMNILGFLPTQGASLKISQYQAKRNTNKARALSSVTVSKLFHCNPQRDKTLANAIVPIEKALDYIPVPPPPPPPTPAAAA